MEKKRSSTGEDSAAKRVDIDLSLEPMTPEKRKLASEIILSHPDLKDSFGYRNLTQSLTDPALLRMLYQIKYGSFVPNPKIQEILEDDEEDEETGKPLWKEKLIDFINMNPSRKNIYDILLNIRHIYYILDTINLYKEEDAIKLLAKYIPEDLLEKPPQLSPDQRAAGKQILRQFIETRYVSDNQNLQRIFLEIEAGSFRKNAEIEHLIRNNQWREFDQYCQLYSGIDYFWITLQNLFYLYYYDDPKIDFKQMQNALGIQQAQWSVDPSNEFKHFLDQTEYPQYLQGSSIENISSFHYSQINFTLFDDMNEKEKRYLKDYFSYFLVGKRAVDGTIVPYTKEFVETQLKGSIWYKVLYDNPKFSFKQLNDKVKQVKRNMDEMKKHEVIFDEKQEKDYQFVSSFTGFTSKDVQLIGAYNINCYSIPSTYDFSKFTCFHQPTIVFGQMSPPSLINFIIKENKRPYAGHLPGAKSNLVKFDDRNGDILANWVHDFEHQRSLRDCSLDYSIQKINEICPDSVIKENDDVDQNKLLDPQGNFQKCINDRKNKKVELILDGALQFKKYTFPSLGGSKRRRSSKRKNKTRRNKRKKCTKKKKLN
jgi:hypothetical protein